MKRRRGLLRSMQKIGNARVLCELGRFGMIVKRNGENNE